MIKVKTADLVFASDSSCFAMIADSDHIISIGLTKRYTVIVTRFGSTFGCVELGISRLHERLVVSILLFAIMHQRVMAKRYGHLWQVIRAKCTMMTLPYFH